MAKSKLLMMGATSRPLQPHHASGTVETRKAMGKLVRDNLKAHFSGAAPITPVV